MSVWIAVPMLVLIALTLVGLCWVFIHIMRHDV